MLLGAPDSAQPAPIVPATGDRLAAFKSPSGRITCVISVGSDQPSFAQCELRSMPRRGGFSIRTTGRVRRYDVRRYDDLAHRRFLTSLRTLATVRRLDVPAL